MGTRATSLTLLSLGALAGLIVLVLLLTRWLLDAPWRDLRQLGMFLALSGGATLVIGHLVVRFGLGKISSSLRAKLWSVLLLASFLALINVAITAQLMFISAHDLALLALLLLFSLGMSIFFAFALASAVHKSLASLVTAARRLGSGQLGTRVEAKGRDELAEVAGAFNSMAEQLEAASRRQEELERARRGLIASVSHDLRTPLASMRAMVESLNDGVVSDPETMRRYLRTTQSEIEYLSRLIDDLFELSQIDSGLLQLHLEPANLRDLISDTLESISAQAQQRHLTVKGEVTESLPNLVMDAQRVQRVLYNLLQNALRHTPADGSIVIQAQDTGQEVVVRVSDTGEGIAPAELAHLFERFQQVPKTTRSRTTSGSGLGLAIARGIIEAHGGRIWAESPPGRGASFSFTLPK